MQRRVELAEEAGSGAVACFLGNKTEPDSDDERAGACFQINFAGQVDMAVFGA